MLWALKPTTLNLDGVIPANPQSTKTWRQTQKFLKWEPFLLADLFFLDFTFFNATTVTLYTKLMNNKCKKSHGR